MAALAVLRCVGCARSTVLRSAPNKWSTSTRSLSVARLLLTERRFTEKHEWVTLDGEVGTVGITDHAQQALGDIVYVELPDVDAEFAQSDECGALESVKAASELYCPVSGTITEKNASLEDKPGLINSSCYEDGWLFKLKLSKMEEFEALMSEDSYKKFLKEQE